METTGYTFNQESFGNPSPFVQTTIRCLHQVGRLSGHLQHKDRWVIDYSISNCGRCRVGSEREPWLPRTPGIAHLYPPSTLYWEDTSGVEKPPLSSYIIFLGGEKTGLDRLCVNAKGFARISDAKGRLGALLDKMAENAARHGDEAFCETMADFYAIAALLGKAKRLENGYEFILDEQEREASFGSKVRTLIAERLAETLEIAPLAKSLGISESTLYHRYRQESGESPVQTQLRLRIELAKSLLRTGCPIKEAARQTGFYDEFHFSKTFKRITAKTPSRFVQEMKA